MHRLGSLALTATALTLALSPATQAGTPVTNPNGVFLTMDANVLPFAGTGSGIEFSSFTGNRLGAPTSFTSDIKVAFPAGAKFNGSILPRCTVDPKEFSACAANTQVGAGTAEGAITGPDGKTSFVPVDLKGYNGSVVEGKPTLIFQGTAGGKVVAELDFQINGNVLDDYKFPDAAPSSIGIAQFNLLVPIIKKGKGKKAKFFYTNPKSCPKRGWDVTQTDVFDFGTLKASSNSPCVKVVKKKK